MAAKASPPGLYVFDASQTGSSPKRLVAGKTERNDLKWSPDGEWIASRDTADFLVDVIPKSGGTVRDVESVEWSRNGSKIAYSMPGGGLFVGPSNWGAAT